MSFDEFVNVYVNYRIHLKDSSRADFKMQLQAILDPKAERLNGETTDPKKVQFARDITGLSQLHYVDIRRYFEIEGVVNGLKTILEAKAEMDEEVTSAFGLEPISAQQNENPLIGFIADPLKIADWISKTVKPPSNGKRYFKIGLDGFGISKVRPMVMTCINPCWGGYSQLPLLTVPIAMVVAKENASTVSKLVAELSPKLSSLSSNDGNECQLAYGADFKAMWNTKDHLKWAKRIIRLSAFQKYHHHSTSSEEKVKIQTEAKKIGTFCQHNLIHFRVLSLL
jgi:hypothetical protein